MSPPTENVVRTPRRFEIALPGGAVAFADYHVDEGDIVFPHTVTPPAFRGQGLAARIAEAALAYAREQGLKVRPHCSFFRDYIAQRPDLHDLVHPDERAGLSV